MLPAFYIQKKKSGRAFTTKYYNDNFMDLLLLSLDHWHFKSITSIPTKLIRKQQK